MGVMEQPIQEGGDRGGVAEEFAPVLDGAVRSRIEAFSYRSLMTS
jgi:hypothetical protein